MRAGGSSALAELLIRLWTPTACHWGWEARRSLLGAASPQTGSHAEDHPTLDRATRGICPPEHAMLLILSRSLHSLTTGRAIWAAHLQRTSNTSAKQSQFSKAAMCILNCRAELQASSAVAFICTPRSVGLSRCLSCWLRKKRLKMRFFFLPHVAKSFSNSFILSSSWTVWDWLRLTNPVTWLSAEKPQEGKSPP